jgi:ribonuclease P protein component
MNASSKADPRTATSAVRENGRASLSANRLRKHADYQRVYAASRKRRSASMSWFLAPQGELSVPRVGLTAGKVLGKSHERNRIKVVTCTARAGRRRRLQVCADVLGVREHRDCDAWAVSGEWACDLASAAVPPILPRRARSSPSSEKTQRIKRRQCRSFAAQAFTIEREVRLATPIGNGALGTRDARATPQRQEKLFARNSQS